MRYEITSPDGRKFEVTAPDGASEQEVMAYAQGQFKPPAKPQETVKPDDPGALAAAGIGFGRQMDKLMQGVKQMALTPAALVSDSAKGELARMRETEQFRDEGYKALQDQRPISTAAGEVAPLLTVPMGAGLKTAALAGALPGLIEYGTVGEKLGKAAAGTVGSAAGYGIGKAIGRVAQPIRAGEQTASQRAVDEAANRLGVHLSAGEATGNRALKWAESTTADLPIASGMATKRHAANQAAMNAAALREIGQSGREITPEALAAARQGIGSEYDRILAPAKIELDNSFRTEVKAITGSKVMRELRDEQTDALLAQFQNMPAGKIHVSGEWFQQNKTALDAAVRGAYNNGQPAKAKALESFEKALDRAAMRSLSAEDQAAYKTAQRQWASLRMLETGKVVDEGRVMPGRLDQAMTSRYKGAYKEGKITGDLADVARMANTLRAPPNSGTVPRAMYSGGIGGAALLEPTAAVSMLAAPAATQALLTSPAMRRYLQRGLLSVSPEMDRLLGHGGASLGLLGASAAY